MNEYQVTEFAAQKKMTTIHSTETNLYKVLADFYHDKINSLFDDKTGQAKGFISIFVNSQQLLSIQGVCLNHRDEIQIVTSIAGG
ncbi:MAG: hypothetical protein A3F46_10740 [Legionellales bacterium RIFCSPHIGHO2_12_FULL_42_9]|nr:MAG: hypothetical protein A3F46_10740 [Legionellales bacterium RIFCSPHIGHO2_12_FULL_42_9]